MDPAWTFCPNVACAARGQTGQGHIGIHARKAQRFICTACRQTFTATQGTARSRLRTAAETVRLVVPLMAHGGPRQAIVVACGDDERTVARWLARAGRHGQAVTGPHWQWLLASPIMAGPSRHCCRFLCHRRAGHHPSNAGAPRMR